MNQATAGTITSALIAQGIDAHAYPVDTALTNWKIDAQSGSGVDIGTINTFLTNHPGLSGKAGQVTLT